MAKFAVILPAAGQSSRFQGFRKKKPFVELKGRPIWVRTVEHFINRDDVCQVILVISKDDMEWFKQHFRANLAFLNLTLVAGGDSRAESVANGLAAMNDEAEFVAVHDAARPILKASWIDTVFSAAKQFYAAIPGLAVSSTVKRVSAEREIQETVDRRELVLAQTPQVFQRRLLEEAYAGCTDLASTTDDASVVEKHGRPVYVVDGWPMNIKITTAEDFKMAEQFLDVTSRSDGLKKLHPFSDGLLG